jgi:(p)ppGpp synthase/HD superfamily hydrolase
MPRLTLSAVDAIAAQAHAGQVDKIGVPYIEHPRAVAAGLAPFGVGLQMAALLHDVLEDTDVTPRQLLDWGVPLAVVDTVQRVSNEHGETYERKLEKLAMHYGPCLVKIADNAHNSHPDRTAQLPPEKRQRLAEKYRNARSVLWPSAPYDDVRAILAIVNPSLLVELAEVNP